VDDASFLTLTGFSKRSFKNLLLFGSLTIWMNKLGSLEENEAVLAPWMKPVSLVYICST
jgi:hypothetical protein